MVVVPLNASYKFNGSPKSKDWSETKQWSGSKIRHENPTSQYKENDGFSLIQKSWIIWWAPQIYNCYMLVKVFPFSPVFFGNARGTLILIFVYRTETKMGIIIMKRTIKKKEEDARGTLNTDLRHTNWRQFLFNNNVVFVMPILIFAFRHYIRFNGVCGDDGGRWLSLFF